MDMSQLTPDEKARVEIAEVIRTKGAVEFKNLHLPNIDINLPIHELIEFRAAKAGSELHYFVPRNVNAVCFAVICENYDIVKFLLENKNPDFSILCDGFNAIHFAAIIEDPSIMGLLLQCDAVQEILDNPVQISAHSSGQNSSKGSTNVLHVAVTNRRYKVVSMLLSQLPPVVYQVPKPEEGKARKKFEPKTINIRQKSESGATPLRIAVKNNDEKMVNLLLAGMKSFGVSTEDIAADINECIADIDVSKELNPDVVMTIKAIRSLLQASKDDNSCIGDIDTVRATIFSEDKSLNVTFSSTQAQPEGSSHNAPIPQAPSTPLPMTRITIQGCAGCSSTNVHQCPSCHRYFCDSCNGKPRVHPCARSH